MLPAFGPGLSSTPCCSCDLSTVEGCSGPATVALGGAGAEPVTAAPGAAWPAPCVGSGAVACGETPPRDRRARTRPVGGRAVLVDVPQGPAQARPARRQAGDLVCRLLLEK